LVLIPLLFLQTSTAAAAAAAAAEAYLAEGQYLLENRK
jgi:hypothetical protein